MPLAPVTRMFISLLLPRKLLLNVGEGGDARLRFGHVQDARVVGIELREGAAVRVPLGEEFIVVETAVVGGDPVKVPHVLRLGALLVGEEGLIELLAVADADDADVLLFAAEQLAHRLRLGLDGAGGGLLNEEVAVLSVFKSEEHQIDRFLQRHDEAGHGRLGDGDGLAVFDLVDPQRNDAAPGTHDVAVPGAADAGLPGGAGLGYRHLLLQGLGDAHGVDGVGGLVGGQADDALHPRFDGGGEDVIRADDVGTDGLHGEELAGGHLLEGGGVEHIVHANHGGLHGREVSHVANVKLDFPRRFRQLGLKFVAHIVLLLLVAGKDADLGNIGIQEAVQHGVAKDARTAGDEEGFVLKHKLCLRFIFLFKL